jgi:phosphatidate phosphatase APP1
MPFLVLTRAGLEDIRARTDLVGTVLFVNPMLLTADDAAALRDAGAEVRELPAPVDPQQQSVLSAIDELTRQHGAPLWVEHAASSMRQPAPPAPAGTSRTRAALPRKLAKKAGGLAGWTLHQIRKQASFSKPLLIIPYFGYGNPRCLMLRGRVLVDEGFGTPSPDDSAWRNLKEFYKRLESDQVAGARIRARFQGMECETVSDRGGYFLFEFRPSAPLATNGWHAVDLELIEPRPARRAPVHATAEVLVPAATARFGVISDIDDTVLWTNVTNRLKMLLMLARSNAHTRKPFKGVASFYRALCAGASGDENNPIFYVSSSPWHLFSPLIEFLRTQNIPLGPLMLKELSLRKLFGSGRHRNHKLEQIENILRYFPDLQFVLIGDSGEQDPEIYAEVVKRHPRAVRMIYIRNVNPDPSRIEALDRLIVEVRAAGTHLVLAPDSEFAATHAAAEGLIHPDAMAAVRSDRKEDEGAGPVGGQD